MKIRQRARAEYTRVFVVGPIRPTVAMRSGEGHATREERRHPGKLRAASAERRAAIVRREAYGVFRRTRYDVRDQWFSPDSFPSTNPSGVGLSGGIQLVPSAMAEWTSVVP